MTKWVAVTDERSYGIAVHNYQETGDFRIKLTVGECVYIIKECKDWYYGYVGKQKSALGIFPRSFIHIMDTSFKDVSCGSGTYNNQPHIVSEVTAVLREWGGIWKRLYITHSPIFKNIEHKMYELIRLRSQILSGTLPVDELREIKRLVTWNIDVGNNFLGLDMVVRDDQGNILNPKDISVIELFRHHENATQKIHTPSTESSSSYQPLRRSHNYTVYLSVRNLICKSSEDVELLFTLYDLRLSKSFSENFVIRWTHDMFVRDQDRRHNFRVLFTDLGSRDLAREKVYLVCYVIKNGAMESHANCKTYVKNGTSDNINTARRAYAIACMNLSPYLNGQLETDEDKHHFLHLLPCEKDKDTLEGTLRRCFSLKEFPTKDSKGQGIIISFKLLQADLKQVREENPHLVFGNVGIARKMGFPEVILPGDVRNDLYLTLAYGEFSKGSKSSDKNIECMATVCNEKGVPLQGGIILGCGVDPQTEYHSVVYYHEDKPRWFETLKVAVSIEEFKGCHLRFIFRHRSSKNDSKEKNEKPFALSFVRLMQENGTTLRDERHDLLVYKVDPKKYDPTDISYLELASTELEMNNGFHNSVPGLNLCSKDTFVIYTNLCSTKLTQNVDLLGLLNWGNDTAKVADNLQALMKVEGEEVVKLLHDVLDTLFDILRPQPDSNVHDDMVFNCLLYVIGLVSDRKYLHFQPVLDLYIEETFCATLAYNKLIIVLKRYIDNVINFEKDRMLGMMKSLKYIMKFITRSRYLFSELYDGKGQDEFEDLMADLLEAFGCMMRHKTDPILIIQGACLKYLPATIPDLMIAFKNSVKLSYLLMKLINSLPNSRLTKQKMMTIDDIIHSPLFCSFECRAILLNKILELVKKQLESSDEGTANAEHRRYNSKSYAKIAKVLGASTSDLQPPDENVSQLELCIKILSDIMDSLFHKEVVGDTTEDITKIMLIILRTVIQTTIKMDRENPLVGNLASVMISIFRQMTSCHFKIYIDHFNTRSDLLDFLMEILLVFKDLISRPVYNPDWCEMILLQNRIILRALRFFALTIRDQFSSDFEHQVWNNFFHCAVAFLTQPALQLETFSANKRSRIASEYKDMRIIAAFEIRNMWFNLAANKVHFVPNLVSPFLEMTLIPEEELRKATIPIFFDMMQTEFYLNRDGVLDKKDDISIKANFCQFEAEMIAKLDSMVEGGRGDEQYKNLFHSIMMNLCENHVRMRDLGIKFVSTVTRLMELLLEYRCFIFDENRENRMMCIVNLLDFYHEINRKEMYIRYVNKLCALHLECENYPEAAYTLRLHSKLLSWSDTPLPPLLRSLKYPQCETHRQLKEALYNDMIAYFDKGKMWECALCICKELVRLYEEETFDYNQLSLMLRRMSQFYDCIIKQLRPKSEYFRVAYYGKGFPPFLSNKVFVHRGKEYDRLSDFCSRMMNQHVNAELMTTLTPPSEDILESPGQYLQINHVEPIMDEKRQKLLNKTIHESILRYHKVNNVLKFQYSRPFYRYEDGDDEKKFANMWLERTVLQISSPLPGILKWFQVVAFEPHLISPLQNAIEMMRESNKKLRELIVSYKNDYSLSLNPLTMKLNGIVDPAVMGGIRNYEEAFFTLDYEVKHPDDVEDLFKLKDLIASLIPLLEVGIQIHGQRAPPSLAPLHKRIEEQFAEMKRQTEEKYGKRTTDIKCDSIKYRRRTTAGFSFSHHNEDRDRFSQMSSNSTEERLSRSFVPMANPFSSTPTLNRGYSQAKSPLMSTASLSSSIAILTAPALSNCNIGGQKFGTIGSLTKKEKKEKKKRRIRSESKVSIDGESINSKDSSSSVMGNSQWYTIPTNDVDNYSLASCNSITPGTSTIMDFEQPKSTQFVKSDSEREKTCSRPSSDSSFHQFDQLSILSKLNRDSFGTNTDSTTTSDDDRVPPPLPAKNRELDYGSAVCEVADSPCSTPPPSQSLPDRLQSPSDVIRSSGDTNEQPPTPPPKKPTHRFNHTLV